MLKTCLLTAAVLALGVPPALAQAPRASQAPSATQAATPAAAVVAPAVGVVVDPSTGTAVIVPVNPRSDVPPDVTVLLKGLYATGKIRPGQIAQIVIQRSNKVTEVIANAPVP